MNIGVVIPVGAGREENLRLCLQSLEAQTVKPQEIVVVFDGQDAVSVETASYGGRNIEWIVIPKHQPGQEQPRNVGVKCLRDDIDAVWFVDSDILFEENALQNLALRFEESGTDIIMAPYDWMQEGLREMCPALRNDPRWPMFEEERWKDLTHTSAGELNVGLGCFSGNLMWKVSSFKKIGGFWNELHHGRCEDGELGLHAVADGYKIACEPHARGYHLAHPVNMDWVLTCNERDVPMLNARHPWVEGAGLFIVEEDGKRFNQLCPICGESINTGAYWGHVKNHV